MQSKMADDPAHDRGPTCPVCGSLVTRTLPARIAPFMAARTGTPPDAEVHARFCDSCEHVFFTPFVSDEGLALLYAGYRDDAYTRERVGYEPSYADLAPLLHDDTSHLHDARRDHYASHFAALSDFKGLVVDFGGGSGYWTRQAFPSAEIAIVEEGYERNGGDLNGLLGRADFLFATHTFEHVPRPTATLSRLTRHMRPGAQVYIELPKEYPGGLRDAFFGYEQTLRDGGVLPWVGPLVMHEHLAHFSERSLLAMMSGASVRLERDVSTDSVLAAFGTKV